MKKLFLFLFSLLAVSGIAHALTPEELLYAPVSSFTDASTNGDVLFTSAPINIIGVTISSPGPNSSLTFYRSTSTSWTPDISTQVFVWTDYVGSNGGPTYIDLFGIKNTSYTHINKAGNAKLIIWIQCAKENLKAGQPYYGFCPGMTATGSKEGKMNRIGD